MGGSLQRTTTLLVLLLAVALGGCINGNTAPAGDEAEVATDEPADPLVTLHGCSEHVGLFPLPPMATEGYLPDGFTPVPFEPGSQTVTLVSVNYVCSAEADDGERIAEAWGAILVEPPEDYRAEEIEFYVVPLGGFSSDETMAASYAQWGLGEIVHGQVQVELTSEGPAGRVGQVEASAEGQEVTVVTEVTGEASTAPAGHARLIGVQDDTVQGMVDLAWTESQGLEQGHATLIENLFLPVAHPVTSGVGAHYWGQDYDYTIEPVPLPQP